MRQRSRKRLALLCANLAALQEESMGANQVARLIAVDCSLPSDESSPGARSLAEVVRREAGHVIGDYVTSAETAGLTPRTLLFIASELSPNRPNAWAAMLLGAEVSVLMAVTLVYSFFVAPSYQKLFDDFAAPMPGITRFMLSLLAPNSPFVWLLIVVAAIVLIWRLAPAALAPAASALDRVVLALPEIGSVQRTRNSDVLAGWLGHIGPANHQTTERALRAAVQYDGDRVCARACRRLETSIAGGASLQEALGRARDFDAQIGATVAATERDAGLDLAAALRARWRASQVTNLRWPNRMVVIAQLIIGLFVALIVTALYVPIFNISLFF